MQAVNRNGKEPRHGLLRVAATADVELALAGADGVALLDREGVGQDDDRLSVGQVALPVVGLAESGGGLLGVVEHGVVEERRRAFHHTRRPGAHARELASPRRDDRKVPALDFPKTIEKIKTTPLWSAK